MDPRIPAITPVDVEKIKPKLQPTVDTDQLKKGLETENLVGYFFLNLEIIT